MTEIPSEQKISRHLAVRDQDPRDADVEHDVDATLLTELRTIKARLNELPDIALDATSGVDWRAKAQELKTTTKRTREGIARSPSNGFSGWIARHTAPLAMAASVFFVSAVGIFVTFSTPDNELPSTQLETAVVSDPGFQLASLMTRSRDLERVLESVTGDTGLNQASAMSSMPEPVNEPQRRTIQLLRYRLVDIDAEIAGLYETPTVDVQRRNALWAQRVEVLESLVLVQGQDRLPGMLLDHQARSM